MTQKYNYITIQLVPNDSKVNRIALLKTEYAKIAKQLTRYMVIGGASHTLKRDKKLDLWQDITPRGGKITFELIVQLPFYLPAHRTKDEYPIKVGSRTYVINNRQVELIMEDAPNKYFFCHAGLVHAVTKQYPDKVVQTIHLPTLVSTIHRISCVSVSEAVENHMHDWIESLNKDISSIVSSLRNFSSDVASIPEFHSVEDTCTMYLLAKSANKTGLIQFISKIHASPIRAFTKVDAKLSDVEKHIADNRHIPYHYFLDSAVASMRSGQLSSALIFACTACESALNYLVEDELRSKGLGRNKIKDAMNDLRFSQQLNLITRLVPRLKRHQDKIVKIDRIRKLRNNLIHRGTLVQHGDVAAIEEGVIAIKDLINGVAVLRKRS